MIAFNKEDLHPVFQDAIMLSEIQTGHKWYELYMDKEGELSIIFEGRLNEEQIKKVLMHFKDILDNETDLDNTSVKPIADYIYRGQQTEILTPDGYNYSQWGTL